MVVDLSLMNFEQWVRFVFEHPVPEDPEREESWYRELTCEVSQPTALIAHVTRMCREAVLLGQRFTPEQVDQGIWLLLGPLADVEFGRYLLDSGVPLEQRLVCIQAMTAVYAQYVPLLQSIPNCFDMWWDLIGDSFWSAVRSRLCPVRPSDDIDPTAIIQQAEAVLGLADRVLSGEVVFSAEQRSAAMAQEAARREEWARRFTDDERAIFEAIPQTLQQILELPYEPCQHFALHGLGHLHHPAVPRIIGQFLDQRAQDWSQEAKAWARQCAQGQVM